MISSILEQSLVFLPLMLGVYISVSLMRLPDLSLESAYVCGAAVAAALQQAGAPQLLVIAGSIVGGAVVGLVVSGLNQLGRLPFLLAAIITNGLFHGIILYLLGSATVSMGARSGNELLLMAGAGLLVTGLVAGLLRSQLGYCYTAYGSNPLFLDQHGLNTSYVVVSGVTLAGTCGGLSGYFFTLSNGFADLSMGYGLFLTCLTALILGKGALPRRLPSVLVPIVGLLLLLAVQQFLLRMGLNLRYYNSFQALFVTAVLLGTPEGRQAGKQSLSNHLGV